MGRLPQYLLLARLEAGVLEAAPTRGGYVPLDPGSRLGLGR